MNDMYQKYKGLLFKLAYQLTGSITDAEDVVHDVFLKLYDVPPEKLNEPKAYLCKMVTNRCKDLQKSARKKREHYFGEWLPEPLFDSYVDAMEVVIRDDQLSYAILVLLERLTPTERVVFVLREALSFTYNEISKIIEKSEVNCRKVYSRASAKMGISSDDIDLFKSSNQEITRNFQLALKQGNVSQIVSMLDPNIVLISDGGGKVSAAAKPILIRDHVARFLAGPVRNASMIDGIPHIQLSKANGQPAFIFSSSEGIHTVAMLYIKDNMIYNLYLVRNPDKLIHVRL